MLRTLLLLRWLVPVLRPPAVSPSADSGTALLVEDVMLYATVGCGALLVETALLYVMVYRSCPLLLAEIVMHHALVVCGALPPLEETAAVRCFW